MNDVEWVTHSNTVKALFEMNYFHHRYRDVHLSQMQCKLI